MADQNESWILHDILDRKIGSREMVETSRKLTLLSEKLNTEHSERFKTIHTGSVAEGIGMAGSDMDVMYIYNDAIVICPEHVQDTRIPPNNTDKTVFMMRDTDSRPGYVTLELMNLEQKTIGLFVNCTVPVRDKLFISSEMFNRVFVDTAAVFHPTETHGPALTMRKDSTHHRTDVDLVKSFLCSSWPPAANEWVSRPHLYGWPDEGLKKQIVQGGCCLVPTGDKTSADPFLQWRISFATAERTLVYSLTHTQFLIYGLLKYFLKQIGHRLEQITGEADILSSYIIKTVIFHAVESTPVSLWQEKNTFFCFMLCFKILIAWVKAGYCPNYFINSNNMFHGKVCGENQQKILRFLIELHDMKWECLSVGTFIQPSIGTLFNRVRNGHLKCVLSTPKRCEGQRDITIFHATMGTISVSDILPVSTELLSKSKSDIEEFVAYIHTVTALACTGVDIFEKHVAAKGNKEKYKYLRKCKNLMKPLSSVCTSPGLLTLATFHYQTGNYMKTLDMCGHMISSFKMYFDEHATLRVKDRYEHLYCGRGYTLLHKCQEVCVSSMYFDPSGLQFCPSHLHNQLIKVHEVDTLCIPPLPYAVFLTFLCYHELGDTRRRNTSLTHLRAVKYDKEQGGGRHWIVHNLLGICYEIVGDTRRALREYRDSLGGQRPKQFQNPALERIERLQLVLQRQNDEH